eukprot:TRINITY_DN7668_c0_g2_i1.p1 TRINITY_DN7668_c0_g2~~TRINITY_DN7668_c0_g2_i1.p1  ORF type:complete len:292 (+),score=36.98 TRINITY_DN7668_c0_g2_i1:51-926(+)
MLGSKALFFAALWAVAVTETVRLWPGLAPGDPPAGTIGPEVVENGMMMNVTVPEYEPFLNLSGHGSGIVIAPGGGYMALAIYKEGTDVAKWLNSIGFHAFVLKYRVPVRQQVPTLPGNWAPLQDAQRAMGIIRSKAAEYHLNASRLGFLGFSAGSHLTAHISTTGWGKRIYNKTIPADDEPCRPSFSVLNYPWHCTTPNQSAISDELLPGIGPTQPPAFFSQAMNDPAAPCENSLLFMTEMKKRNAPLSELHLWPDGGHGYGLCQNLPKTHEVCTWPQRAELWFRSNGWIQ